MGKKYEPVYLPKKDINLSLVRGMPAVMSMWSQENFPKQSGGASDWERFMLLWVWSTHLNRKFFGELHLYLTSWFKELLVDGLGIQADYVSTELDNVDIPAYKDLNWWVAGKLWTHRLQHKPFIQIDYDAWLVKPLQQRILDADLVAQNTEQLFEVKDVYPIEEMSSCIKVPSSFSRYHGRQEDFAINTGFFGGKNLDFIHSYVDSCFEVMCSQENIEMFDTLNTWLDTKIKRTLGICIIMEQYGLACKVREHDVKVQYLFNGWEEMSNRKCRLRVGYEHLLGPIKRQSHIEKQISIIVRRYLPDQYRKVQDMLKSDVLKVEADGLFKI
jgi:hypothetical protein